MDYQWKELYVLDQVISDHARNSIKNSIHFSGVARNHGKSASKNVMLAGSAFEGSILSRCFLPLKTGDINVNKECEFDLEFVLFDVPINLKDRLENTEKNGFTKVKLSGEELYRLLRKNGWKFGKMNDLKIWTQVTGNGCLNPSRLKEVIGKRFRYKRNNFTDAACAVILNKSFSDVTVDCVCPGKLTRSSIKVEVSIKVKEEAVIKLSYDAVFIIRLAWWPEAAQEWRKRNRSWPKRHIIEGLTSCSYIIPKPLKRTDGILDDAQNSDILDFRYTFSHIERELILLLCDQQHFVYFIFKSTFYKHIKSISPETIQSYSAKTVMLWTCEKFPPDNLFWGDNWESTIDAIVYLFKKLLHHFRSGHLEHYFIRQINVIDNIPLKLNKKILEKLDILINNIDQYIPQSLHGVSEFGKLLRQFFGTAEEITDVILNKKQIWRFILRNPKLSIRTLYCLLCHKYYLFYINIFLLKSFIVLILFFTIYFYNFFHFLYIW